MVSRWVRFPHGKAEIGRTETATPCALRQLRILSTLPEEVKCCRMRLGFRRRRRTPFFQAHVRLCDALPEVLRDQSAGQRLVSCLKPPRDSGRAQKSPATCRSATSPIPGLSLFRDAIFHFTRIETACRTMLLTEPETYGDKTWGFSYSRDETAPSWLTGEENR